MNADFPRILTLLRKERGISQKQAASDLGISQALLSHYEKGIRECGLDFLVRTADFYQVSCDYLLGRSPERTGATLSLQDLSVEQGPLPESPTGVVQLHERLIANSIHIIFSLLESIDHPKLIQYVSDHLMLTVYQIFRMIYTVNPKNDVNLFAVHQTQFQAMMLSKFVENQAKMSIILENPENKKEHRINPKLVSLSSEELQTDYPRTSSSLLNLIKKVEPLLKP